MQPTTPLYPYGQPMQTPPLKPRLSKGALYCCAMPMVLLFCLMALAIVTRHNYANGGLITQSTTEKMRAYRGLSYQLFMQRFGRPSEEIAGDVRGNAHLVAVYEEFDGYVVVAVDKENAVVDAVEPYGNLPGSDHKPPQISNPTPFHFDDNLN